MKQRNHLYIDNETLDSFTLSHSFTSEKNLLIQVFSGLLDENKLQAVLNHLYTLLPHASIIGTSTSGEIHDGQMLNESIVFSFTAFENTQVKTHYSPSVDFDSGVNTAKKILQTNTKVLIAFSESLQSDPPSFFKGLESINNKVIISGGNAGDNENFTKTFIIIDSTIHDSGIVLCTLNSDVLIVNNDYTLNWTPIGSELTVTKAEGNIVYEINNTPILEIYKYYFGDDIEADLPNSIVDFPLIKNENGIKIARSLLALLDDKSFFFAGNFNIGDKVRFSIGNVNELLNNAQQFSHSISKKPSEAIFIYSCSVRRNFFKEQLEHEFKLLNDIAPSSGFLTYGEFFNTGTSNQVLNITTTILSLSEVSIHKEIQHDSKTKTLKHSPLKSLVHLVNVTQSELEQKIDLLQEAQSMLIESEKMASLGSLVSGVAHEVNTPLGVGLSGISQIEYIVKRLDKSSQDDTLTEEEFSNSISTLHKLSHTIQSSLNNAASLVRSFKHISVDQHSDEQRVFNLSEYLDDTITSIRSQLKGKNISIENSIDEAIVLNSYPGVYAQLFSNLILNSVHHAFDDNTNNKIMIYTQRLDGTLSLHYEDNGKGITPEIEKKIFDPFFTTARGQGGSGLGMNIVYNLITQKLRGNIKLIQKQDKGFHIEILIKYPQEEGNNNG